MKTRIILVGARAFGGLLLLMLVSVFATGTLTASTSAPVFLMQWGTTGTGNGQFSNPRSVALDSQGNVYVADSSNQRIQKFDNFGNFLKTWGTSGSGNGQFNEPRGIGINGNGNLYVADSGNNRVQVFDTEGNYLNQWGSLGTGNNQFDFPRGVCFDASNNVYVTDWNNNRMMEFTSAGVYIRKWGSQGSGNSQFDAPHGCVIDGANDIYVVEQNNHRVQKFDLDTNPPTFLLKWGSQGNGDGQFNQPHGILLDSGNHIQVADTLNHRIQEFNTSGGFVRKWGTEGTGDGQFKEPRDLEEDANGNFFVADTKNDRMQKFATEFTLTVTGAGNGNGVVTATGINCAINAGTGTGDCLQRVPVGDQITLTAAPATDSYFVAWGGDCDANGQVNMTSDKGCSANFKSVANPIVVGCNVNEIITAINDANAHAGTDTIELATNCTYTLHSVNNNVTETGGANGLPVITGELKINGNDAVIERSSSAPLFRFLYISPGTILHLNHLTMRNGMASGWYNAGGAVFSAGTLIADFCTFANNSAHWSGGAIQGGNNDVLTDVTLSGNSAGYGGGYFNGSDSHATLQRVTLSGNYADTGEGTYSDLRAQLDIINSTFANNNGYAAVGAQPWATVNLTNVTFANNAGKAMDIAWGNEPEANATAHLRNTLLWNNGQNCQGTVVNEGNNLDSDGSCGFGGAIDPLLDPAGLKDNGGPTQTIALQNGSPAIDAANDAVCSAAPVSGVDQRGITRPQGTHCDIGAFEKEMTTQTIEDNNPSVRYNGWSSEDNANASGGSYRESKTKNDTVAFTFKGTAVTWIARKGPDMGRAQVTIDGVTKATVDLYNATEQWQFKKTFKKLTNAKHTIVVTVLGAKNTKASDTNVGVDGFAVGAATTDDTALNVKYNTWIGKGNASASGGTFHSSGAKNAKVRFTFTGTQVEWITAKGPNYGRAKVLIDGVNKGTFDLYATSQQWKSALAFTNLGAGQHTIEIRVLGTKKVVSKGTTVIMDAFRGPFQ